MKKRRIPQRPRKLGEMDIQTNLEFDFWSGKIASKRILILQGIRVVPDPQLFTLTLRE